MALINEAQKPYLDTLIEKYRSALKDEGEAIDQIESAQRRKKIFGAALKEEGVDIAAVATSLNGHQSQITIRPEVAALFGHDQEQPPTEVPINDTHALFMLMKKHGNVGFTFGELAKLSKAERHYLNEKAIRNIFWKQVAKKRMEKLPSDLRKIRLTEEGETFTKFRVPKHGE